MPAPRIPHNSRLHDTSPPCGVSAHPPDCLCDVVIDDPVEIATNISQDTYWGMKIALDAGYDTETEEQLIDLLEALALAKDAQVNLKSFDRFEQGKLRGSMELKDKLMLFLKEGNSIVDAPRTFQTSWGNCLASITAGNPSAIWGWPERFWAQIEDFIMEHDEWCGYRALMREFDIDRGPAQIIEKLYRDAHKSVSAAALAYARELYITSPRARTPWLIQKLEDRGYTLTNDQLIQLRARLREAGVIPDRNITVTEWRKKDQ